MKLAVIVSCKTCPYCKPYRSKTHDYAQHKCTFYADGGFDPIPNHYYKSDSIMPSCPLPDVPYHP